MSPLNMSPFSRHFTALAVLGAWILDTKDIVKINLFVVYRVLITALEVWLLYGLFLDLYLVLGNIKKMSWNLSISTLMLGTTFKNQQMLQKKDTINRLRMMLHRDAESRGKPEHIYINELALKELKFLRFSFYGSAVVFIPTWLFSKYYLFFWGVRELPIPFRISDEFDLNNDILFHMFFILLAGAGIFGAILAIETELSMYGLLIQISREYRILQTDIKSIDRMYDDNSGDVGSKEVNPLIIINKTKNMVKMFSERQNRLIEYTKDFESSFNKPLLQEFLGISIQILTLALQCLWVKPYMHRGEQNIYILYKWGSLDFSGNLFYQMGYLLILVINIFLICLFSTKLRTQCMEVGETAYSTLWYKMRVEIQKDMGMIIMRSQHPPKITTGKFVELSLNVFMNMMSNLYGWLALFRQLEASTST